METIQNGKYKDWLTEDGLTRIEGWAREGLIDTQIADKMHIGISTFYHWQQVYPEIKEALRKGKAPVDVEVENALLKRALGYTYTESVTEFALDYKEKDAEGNPKKIIKGMRVTKKEMAPDVGAIAFWLKNRRPDRWRDKREESVIVTEADYSLLDRAEELIRGCESES